MLKALIFIIITLLISGCIGTNEPQTTAPSATETPVILFGDKVVTQDAKGGEGGAGEGDTVIFNFAGYLEDKTLFDTSFEELAENPDVEKSYIFHPRMSYTPLEVTLGTGSLIPGLENELYGVMKGDVKTVEVDAELGYGISDPEKVVAVPRRNAISLHQTFSKFDDITRSQFTRIFNTTPEVDDVYQFPTASMDLKVLEVDEHNVLIEYIVEINEVIELKLFSWDDVVVSVDNETIKVKHIVEEGGVYTVEGAPWNMTATEINDTTVVFWYNAIPTTMFQTPMGDAVARFNDTSVIVNYNHPLSDEGLTFEIEVLDVIQAG